MGADEYTPERRRRDSKEVDMLNFWRTGKSDKSVLLLVDEPIKKPLQFALQENLYVMDSIDTADLSDVKSIEDAKNTTYDAVICVTGSDRMPRVYSALEKIANKNTRPLMTVLFLQDPHKLILQYVNKGTPQNGTPQITEVHEQVEAIVREVLYAAGYLKVDNPSKLPLTHAELRNRLKADPNDPRIRFQAGLFYANSGIVNLAAENFFRAIELDPENKVLTSVAEDPRAALVDLLQTHPGEVPEKYLEEMPELTKNIAEKAMSGKSGETQARVLARERLAEGDPDRAISLIENSRSIDNILLLIEAYAEKGDAESRAKAFDLVEAAEKSSFYAEGPTYQVGLRLPRITGFNTLWIGAPLKRGRGRIVIKRYEREHLERAINETDNVTALSSQDVTMTNGKKLNFADYAVLLEKEGADMVYIIMPLITDPKSGLPAKGLDVLKIPELQKSEQLALAELLTDAQSAAQDSAITHRNPESFRDSRFKVEVAPGEIAEVGFYTRLFVEEVLPFYENAGLKLKDADKKILAELWEQEIDARLSSTPAAFYRPFLDNRIENTLVTFPKGMNQDPTLKTLIEQGIIHRIDLEKGERRHFLTDEFMAWGHEWMRTLSQSDYTNTMRYLTTRKVAEILVSELPTLGVDAEEIRDALWVPGAMLDASSKDIGSARTKLETATRKYLDEYFSWDLNTIFDQIPIADAERHIVVAAYQRKRLREYQEQLKKSKYNSVRTIDTIAKVQTDLPRLSAEDIDLFSELCTLNTFIKTQDSYATYHQSAAGSALVQASDKGKMKQLIRKLTKSKIIPKAKKK